MDWKPIDTAPVGDVILLCNANVGVVCSGYGEWMPMKHVNIPRWIGCDPKGFGRFKATHWMPLPDPATIEKEME